MSMSTIWGYRGSAGSLDQTHQKDQYSLVLSPIPTGADMRSNTALRVIHEPGGVDLDVAAKAAAEFLRALGISLESESLRDTPARMAKAYADLFTPRPFDLTTFPNDEGYDELVLARDI